MHTCKYSNDFFLNLFIYIFLIYIYIFFNIWVITYSLKSFFFNLVCTLVNITMNVLFLHLGKYQEF